MLEAALAAGVTAGGGDVLPRRRPADPGGAAADRAATASTWRPSSRASHNPYADNGIKFFGGDGFKLSDEHEDAIEERLRHARPARARRSAASAPCTARRRTTCARSRCASPGST